MLQAHHTGTHKGTAKKRSDPRAQGLLQNSNPHKLLKKLLFSLHRVLIFIAEGHFNPNENSVSLGKEVLWLERTNVALAFKYLTRHAKGRGGPKVNHCKASGTTYQKEMSSKRDMGGPILAALLLEWKAQASWQKSCQYSSQ